MTSEKYIVDAGGGCGHFARSLHLKTGLPFRVIDSDKKSIDIVKELKITGIEGVIGDVLNPQINGDESIVCFNLILHHLIGATELQTRELQKKALSAWKNKVDYIFVNEYMYESFLRNISGRLIFEITSSRILSALGRIASKFAPSLKANTFGVGVRFRANGEWIKLFEECGYRVISKVCGEQEYTTLPLRLLLIKQVRRDSFLLAKSNQPPL